MLEWLYNWIHALIVKIDVCIQQLEREKARRDHCK